MGGLTRVQQAVFAGLGVLLVYSVVKGGSITRDDFIFFGVLIPSIIVHEVSHGWAALSFGDDTAKRAGRLTLNPIAHVDPWGSILLPAILIFTAGLAFGYAKPVPVNPRKMRSPRNHGMVTALAGPGINIAIAAAAAGVLILAAPPFLGTVAAVVRDGYRIDFAEVGWPLWCEVVFQLGVANVVLAAFNLIPIPPLDGSSVIERFLPASVWPQYLRFRQYSMLILLGIFLLAPELLNWVFDPAIALWSQLLS